MTGEKQRVLEVESGFAVALRSPASLYTLPDAFYLKHAMLSGPLFYRVYAGAQSLIL